jgi:dihydrofolate reductase
MTIVGIVAVAKNLAIGKNGKLPWHYPADLKFFKQTTLHNAVVMGFNTWQAIGKPLPNRLNIVLSRTKSIESQPNVLLLRSREEALALAEYLKGDLFVIGGAETYRNFADAIEKWLVTRIPQTIENADALMPENFLEGFANVEISELEPNLKVEFWVKKRQL